MCSILKTIPTPQIYIDTPFCALTCMLMIWRVGDLDNLIVGKYMYVLYFVWTAEKFSV